MDVVIRWARHGGRLLIIATNPRGMSGIINININIIIIIIIIIVQQLVQ